MDELSFGSCLSLATVLLPLLLLVVSRALAAMEAPRHRQPPPPRWRGPTAPRAAPPGPLMLLRLGARRRRLLPGGGRGGDEGERPRLCQPAAGRDGGRRRLRRQGPHLRALRGVLAADAQGLRARASQRGAGARHGAHPAGRGVAPHRAVSLAAAATPARAVVDLSQGLTALTNNVIARAAFGGECRQQEAYLREIEMVATLAGRFSLPDLFPSSRLARWLSAAARDLRRSHARVERIIAGIVHEHMARRSASPLGGAGVENEDLLDVLLRLQEQGSLTLPLTTEIIGAVISDIFGAATDTTATTLEWAMAELIRNPQAMSRATSEIR
ncbi:LOW QUALITY PROTEIN: hypothetical protein SETIT_9G359900v2 [Setaria italica]|uniref:Cytochrome P450 n=1 Tax=Setaria italica TaxID=4555 RepID=A0A368SPB5_SETIT|nr:LOW QUALITY PROTEIN: hypothetical protein SETIT_9G359900v2 [Setaria italica]